MINPSNAINVNPKEIPVIKGTGKNFLFDKRLRILLKITVGRVMRTSTEITKCQTRDVDTKTCSIAVKGSSKNWESWKPFSASGIEIPSDIPSINKPRILSMKI